MQYDLDTIRDRRSSDSVKWALYGKDVIPLWVADMDFGSPEPVIQALKRRVEHGIFGYPQISAELRELVCQRLRERQNWEVSASDLFFLPGLVAGINYTVQSFTSPGERVLVQPPVYHHFFLDPLAHGRLLAEPQLVQKQSRYEIDFEAFEKSILPGTKLFILCNPHNPVGRVFTRGELEKLADICLRHRLVICSDEIHADLLYPGSRHISLASLSPEISRSSITLLSPSKTYNITGLHFGLAVIQDPVLKESWKKATLGLNPGTNIMGQTAALAAYREGQQWLDQVLAYLQDNLTFIREYICEKIPAMQMTQIEATYLAWLDCRQLNLREDPARYFLKHARVALSEGSDFGKGGEGFVRLNFACPRAVLKEALERISGAIAGS